MSEEYDEWFRKQVEKSLEEADVGGPWISHEEIRKWWQNRRASIERGLEEIRPGLGETVTADDDFFEALRKELRTPRK